MEELSADHVLLDSNVQQLVLLLFNAPPGSTLQPVSQAHQQIYQQAQLLAKHAR